MVVYFIDERNECRMCYVDVSELINAKLPAVAEEQTQAVGWDMVQVPQYNVAPYDYNAQAQPFNQTVIPEAKPVIMASPETTTSATGPTNGGARNYKFTAADPQPNFKFTAQTKPFDEQSRKLRGRSRSTTREVQRPPPLLSAASDPTLLTSGSTSSTLLTHLLTRRSSASCVSVSVPPPPPPLPPPVDQHDEEASPESPGDRRTGHIHAEQKRRYNIKNGFDVIQSLIPALNGGQGAGKVSKAAMLQKGADYIRQLRGERAQLEDEMETLRRQIESLNASISNCQSLLPATGAPVSRRHHTKMHDMFDDYVRRRTEDNWKFWVFSLMVRPLLTSYNSFVSTASLEELYRSTLVWVEQHCTLVELRPIVLNSLRYLCTKTDILAHPESLPSEARQAVLNAQNPPYP